jgi:hypothetical protein
MRGSQQKPPCKETLRIAACRPVFKEFQGSNPPHEICHNCARGVALFPCETAAYRAMGIGAPTGRAWVIDWNDQAGGMMMVVRGWPVAAGAGRSWRAFLPPRF